MNSETKNRSKYAHSTTKAAPKSKGTTTVNLFEMLERVHAENINLSRFVREKLQEHFDELDRERDDDKKTA